MDSLTHIAVAAGMAQAGLRLERRWHGLALLSVAALAPDAEVLLRPFDSSLYIRLYHGPLHSLAGAAGLALILAWLYRRWFDQPLLTPTPIPRPPTPVPRPLTPGPRPLALALAGCGSHLALDFFQGYGEQLFWPLTPRRYGANLMAEFDLPTLAMLAIALIGPALLNLVNREIGAAGVSGRRAAWAVLALAAALLPVRALFRERATATARAALTGERESLGVFPSALVPWRWNVVEDTSIAYMLYEADGGKEEMGRFMARLRKPLPNNLLETAREAPAARAFLNLAFYPAYSLEPGRRGVLVRIRDLAFFTPGGSDRPFSVEVEVTSTMRILAERVLF